MTAMSKKVYLMRLSSITQLHQVKNKSVFSWVLMVCHCWNQQNLTCGLSMSDKQTATLPHCGRNFISLLVCHC